MTKEEALKLWDELYLNEEKAYDYASHPMKREDYENENSLYGWTVDLKQPVLTAGKNVINNLIPSSIVTKKIRENKTSFKVGRFLFEVRRGKIYGEYDIYDITNNTNPINMEPSDENQDPEYNKRRRELISGKRVKTIDIQNDSEGEIKEDKNSSQDEDAERYIDEELKTLRLNEKIEHEGYKPTEEEINQIQEHQEDKTEFETVDINDNDDLNNDIDNLSSEEDEIINEDASIDDNKEIINKTLESNDDNLVNQEVIIENLDDDKNNNEKLDSEKNPIIDEEKIEEIDSNDIKIDEKDCLNCKQIDSLNEKLNNLNSKLIDVQSANSSLLKANKEFIDENTKLKEDLNNSSNSEEDKIKIDNLQDELLGYKEEKENLEKEIEDLKNKLDENSSKLNKTLNDIEYDSISNIQLQDEIDAYKKEIKNLEEKIMSIISSSDNQEKEKELSEQIAEKNIDNQNLQNEILNLKEEKSNLESKVEELNEKLISNENNKQEIENNNEEINKLQHEKIELEEKYNSLVLEKDELDNKIKSLEKENEENQKIIDKNNDKIEDISIIFLNLKDELLGYKEEKDNLLKENESLLNDIKNLKENRNDSLTISSEKEENLNEDINRLKIENEKLNKEKDEAIENNNLLNSTNENLLKANKEFVDLNNELKEKINDSEENENLKNDIQEINNKLSLKEDELNDLNNRFLDVQNANSSLVKANKEFVDELNKLKENKTEENVDEDKTSIEDVMNLKEEIELLEKEIVSLKNRNQELEITKESLLISNKEFIEDNKILKLNQKTDDSSCDKDVALKEDNIALLNTNKNLEKENKILNDAKVANEKTISDLRTALDNYLNKEDLEEKLSTDNANKEAKINELKRQLDDERSKPVEKEIIEKVVYDDSAYLENLYITNGGDRNKYQEFRKLYKDTYNENNGDNIVKLLREHPEYIKKPEIIEKVIPVDNSDVVATNISLVKANKEFVEENRKLKRKLSSQLFEMNNDYILTKNSLLKSTQDFLHENIKLKKQIDELKASDETSQKIEQENKRLLEENEIIKKQLNELNDLKENYSNIDDKYKDSANIISDLESKNNELLAKYEKLSDDYSSLKDSIPQVDLNSEKAREYFKIKFGSDKTVAIDFAGNRINIDSYNNDSEESYLYTLFDKDKEETIDNILVASKISILKFKNDEPFVINNKTFSVEYVDDKPHIVSNDYLINPEAYNDALHYAESSYLKKIPLVYVLIRFKGCDGEELNYTEAKIFANLISTITRNNYRDHLVDIKLERCYLFITFDGSDLKIYDEILRYVTLINSYRRSLYKARKVDAIITLDQIECPSFNIYSDFMTLLKISNDMNMKAEQFELLQAEVVSSNIRPTVHIGSNIISKGLDLSNKNVYNSALISDEFKNMVGDSLNNNYFVEYRYLLWKVD